jgi:hypothetical protein
MIGGDSGHASSCLPCAKGGEGVDNRQAFASFYHAAHHLVGLHAGLHHRQRAQGLQLGVQQAAQRVLALQADHRLPGQVGQRNVLLLGLEPAVGREQLQFALGQHRTVDLWVLRVVQAQADFGLVQQQAPDDLAGRLARQVARRVLEASAQHGNALWQQLIGQRRGAQGAQGRGVMVFQTAGQALYRLQCFVHMGDGGLQLQGFPGGLQAPAHAGEQHEAQLLLGVLECGIHIAHGELQPFGGRAEVSGLQDGLNHFDMT